MTRIYKIIGPPGTGKTFRILAEIEKASKRYDPNRIGAMSFTVAAIEEMRKRINDTLGDTCLTKHVRTMHSMCFQLLFLDKEQVAETHIDEFNKEHEEFRIQNASIFQETLSVRDDLMLANTQAYQQMQVLRNRCTDENKWPSYTLELYRTWRGWMEEMGYYDYTSMLEKVLLIDRYPVIDVLFIDEAQDLSRLQMNIIEKWAANVDVTMLVGDADQAIFRFAGSEPEIFRDINHTWSDQLKKTYRLPSKVYDLAQHIIQQIPNRELIEYETTRALGAVYSSVYPMLDLPGSHMIIARCGFKVSWWIQWLIQKNRLYHNPYRPEDKAWNPSDTKEYKAIESYCAVSSGRFISESEARSMCEHIVAKDNIEQGKKHAITEGEKSKKNVDLFDLAQWPFTDEFKTFTKNLDQIFKPKTSGGKIALLLAEKGSLFEPPVIVGTIHSVKGGEADYVWVDTTESKKIKYAKTESPDNYYDELRIKYVAVTRARCGVGILKG